MTYNGWSNYETWCVKLWLDNDEGLYRYVQNKINELKEEEDIDDITGTLAINLMDEIEERKPENSGMYADLLNAALGEVNWHEIAESFLEE